MTRRVSKSWLLSGCENSGHTKIWRVLHG
jgi:hypothetical protein